MSGTYTASCEHLPHRDQAVSGFLTLQQAGRNIPRVPSLRQGHGLHPEEEEEEEE